MTGVIFDVLQAVPKLGNGSFDCAPLLARGWPRLDHVLILRHRLAKLEVVLFLEVAGTTACIQLEGPILMYERSQMKIERNFIQKQWQKYITENKSTQEVMEIGHEDKDIFGNKNNAIHVLDAIVCLMLLLSCVVNTELLYV